MSKDQRLPIEQVERLVDLLKESGIGEIQVRQGEVEITVKARPEVIAQPQASQASAPPAAVPEPEAQPEADEPGT